MKHREIIAKMSLEEKVAFCSGADMASTKAFERYGIPSIVMVDGPHGLRRPAASGDNLAMRTLPATCFPTASATACSWDRELSREMGEAMGEEALAGQVSILLGPGVNIQRNPLCGRNFEYFSEDPYLAGEMATARIQGVQSKGVGVSIKHFAGNSQERFRMTSDSLIDERALREIYLPAFEQAVRAARPATVMCAYNKLNGVYCSDNEVLLRHILRDEWGFEGVIVSDWGAINDRVQALRAGLDLEMPGGVGFYDQSVLGAVRRGDLAEERVDECVDRLLDLALTAHSRLANHACDLDAHHELARRIAAGSAVLLKNEDRLLPIDPRRTIALIGALAQSPHFQGIGSSHVTPTQVSSLVDGLQERGLRHAYYPGYLPRGGADPDLVEEAIAGARASDLAVVVVGLADEIESEGFDRADLSLPDSHNALVDRVAGANPNTVVVLVAGAPVEMPWLPKVKAVLALHLAGQAGGLAAVDLLSGAVNPSGKLAVTYPLRYGDVPSAGFYEQGGRQAEYRESIYVGYRYYDKAGKEVLFPFGHGLSYTSFEYRDLVLSQTEMRDSETLTVTATIRNAGEQDGAEIVQLYVGDLEPGSFRPTRELRDFTKVFLRAGEGKRVEFVLGFRSFACYDPAAKAWIVPQGAYQISLGASSRDLRLQQAVRVHGTPRRPVPPPTAAWYTHASGPVSRADFETLYGRPIHPATAPRKGQFTLSSTMHEMRGSLAIRIMLRSAERRIAKGFGKEAKSDPTYKMMVQALVNTPLKSVAAMSAGGMPRNLAQGLVDMANGRALKGILSMLKKPSLPLDKTTQA